MDYTFSAAFEMMCDTGNRDVVDEGFAMMKSLADAGDMTAAANLGYFCSMRHTGHHDVAMCRAYLGRAVEAGDPLGQFYMGEMLLFGDHPFERDPVYGKWLLESSAAAGNEDAQTLLARRYGICNRTESRRRPLARLMEAVRDFFRA